MSKGRPRTTWTRSLEKDLKPFNLGLHSAWHRAADHAAWRRLIATATPLRVCQWWWWWYIIKRPFQWKNLFPEEQYRVFAFGTDPRRPSYYFGITKYCSNNLLLIAYVKTNAKSVWLYRQAHWPLIVSWNIRFRMLDSISVIFFQTFNRQHNAKCNVHTRTHTHTYTNARSDWCNWQLYRLHLNM